ncbi:MAG: helix-turn-helix domain-containing protein [Syntrophobacteraceae bacterium]
MKEISNPELALAHDFVEYTDRNVFLTGRAGTGKTTFLHNLKKNTRKRMVVAAPTGVAAINAGGVTLHSFFQLPFGPRVPGNGVYDRANQYRFSREKMNVIKSMDLLVIDEISMVRADLLDGVDGVLRRCRRNDLPFGGVQLLMIGDLKQLSPVVKEEELAILKQFYDSLYFFGSLALGLSEFVTIELKHIYRQSDPGFIELLNRVRDNQLDEATLQKLNSRCRGDFLPEDDEGYITLCTHNRVADGVNQARLKGLPDEPRLFQAKIEGDFPEYSYPTLSSLTLKKGAQVMFVRNDSSPEKLYFNGKIGTIAGIGKSSVSVKCPGDEGQIEAEPAIWENIKYHLDPATGEIAGEKTGSFEQLPLKPAWAITIHKSQGLTFERALIDAGAAFAHGQVYVALSRCKSFEGVVLTSPIPSHVVKTDAAVSRFIAETTGDPPSGQKLKTAQMLYQQRLLSECFDFSRLRFLLDRFIRITAENSASLRVSGAPDLRQLQERAQAQIFFVAEKFQNQLRGLFTPDTPPEEDPVVLERSTKAGIYFEERLNSILGSLLAGLRIETDNKEIAKIATARLEELKKEAAAKLAAVKSSQSGFSTGLYLRALSSVQIDFKPRTEKKSQAPEYSESEIGHPELFQTLKSWRAALAEASGVANYQILHQSVLIQIAATLPENPEELKRIRGMGKRLYEKYGGQILELVCSYRQKHGIDRTFEPAPALALKARAGEANKAAAKDTRQISFDLFKSGRGVSEVARERGLTASTIVGHLAAFVETGQIEIANLLSPEKLELIERKLTEMQNRPLGEIKQTLGESCSYGDIRLVQAHQKFLAARKKA